MRTVSDRTKVLYLSGWGRSGSTLLGNLLGQVENFHHVGELRAWDAAVLDDRHCGCGAVFRDCGFWQQSLRGALGALDDATAQSFRRLRWNQTRYRHLPAMLLPGGEKRLRRRLREYLAALECIYRETAAAGGSEVVVDSSKFATYGWLLGLIPTLDVRVVHLVRDPRAVAYSWTRTKTHADIGRRMRRYDPASSALGWTFWNGVSELLFRKRALTVRYEDFVAAPAATMHRILDYVGEGNRDTGFIRGGHATLASENHTVLGNPGRVPRGSIELREDAEWRRGLGGARRLLVAGLSAPLLVRHGYHHSRCGETK
jgi:hypothetical protein